MTEPAPKSPWGGRFTEPADASGARAFTASLPFDHRLWPHDLRGQRGLGARPRQGRRACRRPSSTTILRGLAARSGRSSKTGVFPYRIELEDIHMNIERRLIEKVGAVGGSSTPAARGTTRSRSTCGSGSARRSTRSAVALRERQARSSSRPSAHRTGLMPGYTHLQRAQPVLLAHHLLAYVLHARRGTASGSPTRAAASTCARSARARSRAPTVPIDRARARPRARLPDRDARNSMDAVSDRDFALEFCAAAGDHWPCTCRGSPRSSSSGPRPSSASSSFPDAYATGSSIMPQKKNPDVAELIRGKTGRVYGDLGPAPHGDEGPPARLSFGHAGGQGGVLRRRATRSGARSASWRPSSGRSGSARTTCGPWPARASPRRPISPATWSSAGCRSATPTRWSAGRCGSPSSAAYASRRSRSTSLTALSAPVRSRLPRGRLRRGLARARGTSTAAPPPRRSPAPSRRRARSWRSPERRVRPEARPAEPAGFAPRSPCAPSCCRRSPRAASARPPVAPERKLPAAVQDLSGRCRGERDPPSTGRLPRMRVDRSALKEIRRTEVYRRVEDGAAEEPVRPALVVFGGLFGGARRRARVRAGRRHHGGRAGSGPGRRATR
mgnify:CR=1 FL=1